MNWLQELIHAQAYAMRATRGPAEAIDPIWRLTRIQMIAWHVACHQALAAVEEAARDLHSNGPIMMYLLRRAASLCPGPIKSWNVGGVWIS